MTSPLMIKRALVWGTSFIIGTAITLAVVYLLMETDINTYSVKYFVLTVISFSMIFVIWGDMLLEAKILPD